MTIPNAQARIRSPLRASQKAVATTAMVIQPSVPEWTWVRSVLRISGGLKSTRSRPLTIPIPTVTRNIAIATE